MKTLANCTPREFMVQTNKIRKSVQNWLSLTKVMEIRKQKTEIEKLPEIPESATKEEKEVAEKARKEAVWQQSKKNLTAMLDAIMDDYPDETIELLGLLCFIDPDDLENHKMTELFEALNEMLDCQEVIAFFTSLMKLAKLSISTSAAA